MTKLCDQRSTNNENDRHARSGRRQPFRNRFVDDPVAHVVADWVRVIANSAAGTGVEADDAAGVEVLLEALVAAVAEVDLRVRLSFLAKDVRQRHATAVPLEERFDRRPLHALVRLWTLRVVAGGPRRLAQILPTFRAEGIEGGPDVMVAGIGDEEGPVVRIAALPGDGVMPPHPAPDPPGHPLGLYHS